jgi:ornithine cyclodeaminase/alanine dehydrogenase-like protein (mu-crystallin family)
VVVTVATLGIAAERITPACLKPGTLIVAVDFATMVSPEVARAAAQFAVDDRAQFEHYRDIGYFDGYPDPTTTLGEAATGAESAARAVLSAEGDGARPTLVTHLGIGLADVVLADAIRAEAERQGAGMELPR